MLPQLLGYGLRRAQSAVFADFAGTFAKAGEALTPGEFGLLVLVERNKGLSQMALARALAIDRSTLVPILNRLQARGLLMRHASPTDGRTQWLVVTRWADEASFQAWVSSPSFGHGHAGADRPNPHTGGPVSVSSELWRYAVAGGSKGNA